MKKTITINGTKANIEKAMAVLMAMGITIEDTNNEAVAETVKEEPKAPAKVESKKSDSFDRKAYESLSREFGCWSEKRNRCFKKCREVVYKAMNGELTKAKAKAEVKKILKTEYNIG